MEPSNWQGGCFPVPYCAGHCPCCLNGGIILYGLRISVRYWRVLPWEGEERDVYLVWVKTRSQCSEWRMGECAYFHRLIINGTVLNVLQPLDDFYGNL